MGLLRFLLGLPAVNGAPDVSVVEQLLPNPAKIPDVGFDRLPPCNHPLPVEFLGPLRRLHGAEDGRAGGCFGDMIHRGQTIGKPSVRQIGARSHHRSQSLPLHSLRADSPVAIFRHDLATVIHSDPTP